MAAASSSHPPARVNRLMRSTGRGTVSDQKVRLISALTAASVPACPRQRRRGACGRCCAHRAVGWMLPLVSPIENGGPGRRIVAATAGETIG
jgi:hypothetical protein